MKTKVIVCTEYSEQARAELLTRFGDRFDITFDEHAAALGDAEICIGEPPLALVQQAEKLRWVQMTWAGTDIYTRRTGFPERVTLTNASGAFGRTISEYVLGGILTMYRNFPAYREQQKQAVWRTVGAERTLRPHRAHPRHGRPRQQCRKAPARLRHGEHRRAPRGRGDAAVF